MTEYEDKARAALDWALKHIAFRHEKRVVADVALAMEEIVVAERERRESVLLDALARTYCKDRPLVAEMCDEYLDRSGQLLGRVRDAARKP